MEVLLQLMPELAVAALGVAVASATLRIRLRDGRGAVVVALAGPFVVACATWAALVHQLDDDAAVARSAGSMTAALRTADMAWRGLTGSAVLALGISVSLGIAAIVFARRALASSAPVPAPAPAIAGLGLAVTVLAVGCASAGLLPGVASGSRELACAPSWLGAFFLAGLTAYVARAGRDAVPLALAALLSGAGAVLALATVNALVQHLTGHSFPTVPAQRWAVLDESWHEAVEHRSLAAIGLLPVLPGLVALAARARLDWRPALIVFVIVTLPAHLAERTIDRLFDLATPPSTVPAEMQPVDLAAPAITWLPPVVPRVAITADGARSLDPALGLGTLLSDADGVDVAIDARMTVADLVGAVGRSPGPVCIVGSTRLPFVMRPRHPVLRELVGGAATCVVLRSSPLGAPTFHVETVRDLPALRAWAADHVGAAQTMTLSVPRDLPIAVLVRAAQHFWQPHVQLDR